jgi:hypothetical protein
MKTITNEKLIQRNKRIGQIFTIVSLAVLGLGLYLSFQDPSLIIWSFAALLAGFIMSQFGIYFGSRWGRSPRPDEALSQALKGLDNKYALYHYTSPVPHLLVGPAGIVILEPYHQAGIITYDGDKKRWKQKGGNLYLKIFAQEGLGRPDLELKNHQKVLKKYFDANFADQELPDIETILVFTNENVEVQTKSPPEITLIAKKLKDNIRKKSKQTPINADTIALINDKLSGE